MKRHLTVTRMALLFAVLTIWACKKDKDDDQPNNQNNNPSNVDGFGLGWMGDEDLDNTPASVNLNFTGSGNLPASADLVPKFPPIGDQGQYGTCVSWAVGYNMKTALNGMDNNWSSSDLSSANRQSSPRDLFTAIPDNQKGPDCNGTNFNFALDVVQNRGVASVQTVPYSNLGNCSQSNVQSNWTSEAGGNKIQYWRKIGASIEAIKENISNNIPVVFGARLADNFMTWNSDAVLTSGSGFDNVGIHAYHAMVVAGYDDSMGPGGAFKVINSWGDAWGDTGYIWIDYNYFINDFCVDNTGDHPLFIAANDGEGGDNPPDVDPNAGGVDLAPWVFADYSTFQTETEREIELNVYNIGNQSAAPDANWSVYYIYFNAYDANDYGVIFYDEFNTTVASNTFECPTSDNCIFNIELPSGEDFATYAFGSSTVVRTYYMPEITGEYYLAMIADAGDAFGEQDELNNVFYTTLYPKYFESGFSKSMANGRDPLKFENKMPATTSNIRENRHQKLQSRETPNAYTTEEITYVLERDEENGKLQQKINDYLKTVKQNEKMYPKN